MSRYLEGCLQRFKLPCIKMRHAVTELADQMSMWLPICKFIGGPLAKKVILLSSCWTQWDASACGVFEASSISLKDVVILLLSLLLLFYHNYHCSIRHFAPSPQSRLLKVVFTVPEDEDGMALCLTFLTERAFRWCQKGFTACLYKSVWEREPYAPPAPTRTTSLSL